MRIDPTLIRHQIENLKLTNPDIWEEGDDILLLDCLEAQTDLKEFLTALVDRMRHASSMAGAVATRIAELELRQGRYERREQAMRELAFKLMQAAEVKKLELAEATLSVRRVPPKAVIIDESQLPEVAFKIVRSPSLTKIKELLANGGCAGATMSNGSETLSVRTK